jgi:hypothetical protein
MVTRETRRLGEISTSPSRPPHSRPGSGGRCSRLMVAGQIFDPAPRSGMRRISLTGGFLHNKVNCVILDDLRGGVRPSNQASRAKWMTLEANCAGDIMGNAKTGSDGHLVIS